MKIHRFICPYEIQENRILITEEKYTHQIKNVLKIQPGEKMIICDGKGMSILCLVHTVSKETVLLEIQNKEKSDRLKTLHLYIALIKKDLFEMVVQKAIEVGVTDITPIITNRTIKKELNYKRLLDIAKEATEQSGQSYLPTIHPEKKYREALSESLKQNEVTIFFDQKSDKDFTNRVDKTIGFFIGPEGGFSEEEIEETKNLGAEMFKLGETTLRAETAAIVSSFILRNK